MTQDSSAQRRRKHMAVMDDKKKTDMTELTRYNLIEQDSDYGAFFVYMEESPMGEYVRFADVEAYLQATLAAALQGAVKPLEWKDGERNQRRAYSILGEFCVTFFGGRWFYKGAPHKDMLDAQAAAQADYQARITSALSAPTDATAALEAHTAQVRGYVLEEAAQFFDSMPEVVFAQLAASAMRSMKGVK